jgi:hypothetical protein
MLLGNTPRLNTHATIELRMLFRIARQPSARQQAQWRHLCLRVAGRQAAILSHTTVGTVLLGNR